MQWEKLLFLAVVVYWVINAAEIMPIWKKKYCRKQNIAGLSILITKISYSMNSSQNKLCTLSKKQMLTNTVS